jgi:thioredoxin-like negative regulator of GroEL
MKIKNMETVNELIEKDLSIFVVKTESCSVCVPIEARLKTILEKYEGLSYHVIYQEDLPEFSGQHLVFSVPTILFFSEGKEVLRESRFVDFNKVERTLSIFSE